jgi:hypothetical protein
MSVKSKFESEIVYLPKTNAFENIFVGFNLQIVGSIIILVIKSSKNGLTNMIQPYVDLTF